jgi:phosphatidylserine decarboxylase
MNQYPHPIIAREGWPFLAISIILAIAATVWCAAWSIPVWIIALFVLQFFRDPPREIPQDVGAVLNVHSNRSPVDGRIEQIQYFPGKFFNADLDKASTENERNAIVLTTTGNQTVTFVQVAGLIARRILCYVKAGDVLARGQRYGFIRFGSRVDVYLPLDASVKVSIGDKVSATTTILAVLAQNG